MIIWGNETAVELEDDSTFEMTFSIVEGAYPGEANLDVDPLFVSPAARDFRLRPDSPAVGAGKNGENMGALPTLLGPHEFVRGETNADGRFDLSDAVTALLYLFSALEARTCLDALDIDDNGAIQVTDAVFLLRFLFRGGSRPPPPFPLPGPDPTDNDPYRCG